MRYLIVFLLVFHVSASLQAQHKLRLAVAGTSHGHAAFIFGRPDKGDIEIVGIYEPDTAVAKLRARQFHLPAQLFYTDLNKMLQAVKPEAVVAFGDIKSHRDIVAAAAPKGIHIMVEKPLATTAADAEYMYSLARKHKVQLLTDYETSWYPSVAKTFELINDSNYVGQIRKVMVNDGHQGPKEIGCGPEFLNWLTDPVLNGGGALMDFGCYGANLMTSLAKNRMPVSVTAVARHFKPDIYPKVEDDATILVDYGDMQCTIQASWNWSFNRKDMEVYGTSGMLLAPSSELLLSRNQSKNQVTSTKVTDKDVHVFTDPFQYFIAVIRGKEQMPEYGLYAPANNVIVVKILEAARKSAATGKTVKL